MEDMAAAVVAKKDKLARFYLLGALSEDLLMHVSTKNTTAKVWACLKTRFIGAARIRAARLSTLHGKFDRLWMQTGSRWMPSPGGLGAWRCAIRGSGRRWTMLQL